MRKSKTLVLILTLLLICTVAGCAEDENSAEEKGDEFFYDESQGVVQNDLSDNFDVKVEEWKYYFDKEADQDRILLSISIKNKTGKRINNFAGAFVLNEKAVDLIANGILKYDKYEPYDLVPGETANGVSYSFDLLVEKDDWLEKKGADKQKLLSEIRFIAVELKWDGGEETIDLVCGELE